MTTSRFHKLLLVVLLSPAGPSALSQVAWRNAVALRLRRFSACFRRSPRDYWVPSRIWYTTYRKQVKISYYLPILIILYRQLEICSVERGICPNYDGCCHFSMRMRETALLRPLHVADADIIFLSCGFIFYLLLSFFLAYSQPSQIGCLPYFHTWCGLSANLECRSETCCTRLAENTGRKNRYLRNIAQVCRAISSQLRQYQQSWENLLSSNMSSTSLQNMVNFGPLAAEIV